MSLSPRIGLRVLGLALSSVCCTACGSSHSNVSPGATSDASLADAGAGDGGAADGQPADTGTVSSVKAPLQGLIDMQSIGWHDKQGGEPSFDAGNVAMFPGVFGGVVINATWDALQPTAGGALDFSTIDSALSQVRAYNAANASAPLGVKLRVYGGCSAPPWALAINGGPVSIQRNPQGCRVADGGTGNCPLMVGKWWTAEYITAWRAFQAELAAKYDSEPLVRQVAVTSCASQTDEPFVPTVEPASRLALSAAGYTDQAQMACLNGAVDDYSAWKYTLVDFTFNVFDTEQGADSGPPLSPDAGASFALGVMSACRTALGSRCVLDNHALMVPLRAADQDVYDAIGAMGGPTNFQTQAPSGMHCEWTATIAQGIALGAEAIEVWPAANLYGFDSLMAPQVEQLAAQFVTPIPVPPPPDATPSCPGFN